MVPNGDAGVWPLISADGDSEVVVRVTGAGGMRLSWPN